jgi:hypothetical protein
MVCTFPGGCNGLHIPWGKQGITHPMEQAINCPIFVLDIRFGKLMDHIGGLLLHRVHETYRFDVSMNHCFMTVQGSATLSCLSNGSSAGVGVPSKRCRYVVPVPVRAALNAVASACL